MPDKIDQCDVIGQTDGNISENNDCETWTVIIPEEFRARKEKRKESREKKTSICFALTNARSLWLKVRSLLDCFDEIELSFMIISQTWFYQCEALDKLMQRLESGENISFLNRTRRKKGNQNPGGGISIAFNKNGITLSEYRIKRSGHEIICARGKLLHNSQPIFIIAAYVTP